MNTSDANETERGSVTRSNSAKTKFVGLGNAAGEINVLRLTEPRSDKK